MGPWIKNNWDKLLTAFVSIVLAGVIGFFSAIQATNDKISKLQSDVAVLLKTSKDLEAKTKGIGSNATGLNSLTDKLSKVDWRVKQVESREQTNERIMTWERQRAVNELEEILKKYGNVKKK